MQSRALQDCAADLVAVLTQQTNASLPSVSTLVQSCEDQSLQVGGRPLQVGGTAPAAHPPFPQRTRPHAVMLACHVGPHRAPHAGRSHRGVVPTCPLPCLPCPPPSFRVQSVLSKPRMPEFNDKALARLQALAALLKADPNSSATSSYAQVCASSRDAAQPVSTTPSPS